MSMLKTIRAAGFAVLLFSCSAESFAQRWDYLGEANVDRSVDHDKIIVTGVRGEFRSIQIRVEKAPVQFDRVVVHYRRSRFRTNFYSQQNSGWWSDEGHRPSRELACDPERGILVRAAGCEFAKAKGQAFWDALEVC